MNHPLQSAPDAQRPGPWTPGLESTLPRRFVPLSTMFRPENVDTSLADAEGLADFCGLSSYELVAFRPERLMLHELLIRVTGDLSVPDGDRYEDLGINFREMTTRIFEAGLRAQLPDITTQFRTLTAAAERRLRVIFEDHLHPPEEPAPRSPVDRPSTWRRWFGMKPSNPPASPAMTPHDRDLAALRDWKAAADAAASPMETAILDAVAKTAGAVIKRHGRLIGDAGILSTIALILFGNDYGSAFVGGRIDPLFREAAAALGYRTLPVQRRAIVMNVKGASASGKSTMRPQQRALAGRLGVRWEDFALISPDIWRKYLLDYDALGEATIYAGTLTGHELEVIDRKLDRYMANKAEQGRMTHLLIDRFRFDSFSSDPDEEDGSRLLTRFGHVVYMFFMITPPEATVERAWRRGLQFGRFKAVDDLLAHNVEAFTGMPRLFFTWALRQGKVVHYEFLDNSVAEGETPRTVAYGVGGEMVVLDPKRMIDIDRFRKINVDARTPEAVYPPPAAMAAERNVQFLRDCARQIPALTFARHDTGVAYARLVRGRLVAWTEDARTIAHADAEIAAALAAVGGAPDRTPHSGETLDMPLRPEDTDTLGAWGGRERRPTAQPISPLDSASRA